MLSRRLKLQKLDDFFTARSARNEASAGEGVYFCRISGCSADVMAFLCRYYEAAGKAGLVLEGPLGNPDRNSIGYYEEVLGTAFSLDEGYISSSLERWLPRMGAEGRRRLAGALYKSLISLRQSGKNESVVKNCFVKYMCWLYFKFSRVSALLGKAEPPKILYGDGGELGRYELSFLSLLSQSGADIVLLLYGGSGGPNGEERYKKLDPDSSLSEPFADSRLEAFPPDFSLKKIAEDVQDSLLRQKLYSSACLPAPLREACTNAWINGGILGAVKTSPALRAMEAEGKYFYNCFCRISGAEDIKDYEASLYRLLLSLEESGRKPVIVEGRIPPPSPSETASIKKPEKDAGIMQMLSSLSSSIPLIAGGELGSLMHKAFIDLMLEEADGVNGEKAQPNRILNTGIYLLCCLIRYTPLLFAKRGQHDVGCFIHLGACRSRNEALFLRLLKCLPADVLVLVPDLSEQCLLSDSLLYEEHYAGSLAVAKFPSQSADLHAGTTAYYAERELDTLLYQDSGMYRNRQYAKAESFVLKTMYEEIPILWKEEVNLRPHFATHGQGVTIPVIFAKVSGVKDGNVAAYWKGIRELLQEESFLITKFPFVDPAAPNPMRPHCASFFRGGRLLKDKVRNHKDYPYAFLRGEVQEHILDKLQLLLELGIVRGTADSVRAFTAAATVLNLNKELLKLLQNFDFTKKNPKLLCVITDESMMGFEDAVLFAFLSLAGFDIVCFVPTGYEICGQHFARNMMEEHQIGGYIYDMQLPDLKIAPAKQKQGRRSLHDIFFKRG